jgi:hypothetical protein
VKELFDKCIRYNGFSLGMRVFFLGPQKHEIIMHELNLYELGANKHDVRKSIAMRRRSVTETSSK